MKPRKHPAVKCPFCGRHFTRQTSRQWTCGEPACVRARRLACCRQWYEGHRDEHIAAVVARRRGLKRAAARAATT